MKKLLLILGVGGLIGCSEISPPPPIYQVPAILMEPVEPLKQIPSMGKSTSISKITEIIIENNGSCKYDKERLAKWQEWSKLNGFKKD